MNEFLRRLLFLPPQRSTIAADIDALHYFVISVTMAGSVLVFLVGAAFVVRYRRPSGEVLRPHRAAAHRSFIVLYEAGFLALLMLLFLMWWHLGSKLFVRLRVAPENSLEVYVTAKQWMWKFAYPNGKRSAALLHVPVHRPIKLVLTSRDVIHSFYVPDFRIKYDALPGRYTTLWFEATEPGTYEILCTEYCGTGHSTMRGQVVVLDPSEYQRWLEEKPVTEPSYAAADERPDEIGKERVPMVSLVNEGQRVAAEQGCFRCHTADGTAHVGPTWAGLYGSKVAIANDGTVVADEAYITESMMDPLAKLVRGYEPLMPSYLGRIRAADTAAIVEFIRSLRDVPREGPGGTDPGPVRLGRVLR